MQFWKYLAVMLGVGMLGTVLLVWLCVASHPKPATSPELALLRRELSALKLLLHQQSLAGNGHGPPTERRERTPEEETRREESPSSEGRDGEDETRSEVVGSSEEGERREENPEERREPLPPEEWLDEESQPEEASR